MPENSWLIAPIKRNVSRFMFFYFNVFKGHAKTCLCECILSEIKMILLTIRSISISKFLPFKYLNRNRKVIKEEEVWKFKKVVI
jgi:hypothetical protein